MSRWIGKSFLMSLEGSTAQVFALSAIPVVGAVGLGVDTIRAQNSRAALNQIVQGACERAAKADPALYTTPEQRLSMALTYAAQQKAGKPLDPATTTFTGSTSGAAPGGSVTIRGQSEISTTLARVVRQNNLTTTSVQTCAIANLPPPPPQLPPPVDPYCYIGVDAYAYRDWTLRQIVDAHAPEILSAKTFLLRLYYGPYIGASGAHQLTSLNKTVKAWYANLTLEPGWMLYIGCDDTPTPTSPPPVLPPPVLPPPVLPPPVLPPPVLPPPVLPPPVLPPPVLPPPVLPPPVLPPPVLPPPVLPPPVLPPPVLPPPVLPPPVLPPPVLPPPTPTCTPDTSNLRIEDDDTVRRGHYLSSLASSGYANIPLAPKYVENFRTLHVYDPSTRATYDTTYALYFAYKMADPRDGMSTNLQELAKGSKLAWVIGAQTATWETPTGACTSVTSPIVLDLDATGEIETTGTRARAAGGAAVPDMKSFDLLGNARRRPTVTEWIDGRGLAWLVDDRDGRAAVDMNGRRLFGDLDGHATGYEKLATLDRDGDGVLKGDELEGLAAWRDDGDAKVQPGEVRPLREWKVTQISVRWNKVMLRGEPRVRSWAVRDGVRIMTEDVYLRWEQAGQDVAAADEKESGR